MMDESKIIKIIPSKSDAHRAYICAGLQKIQMQMGEGSAAYSADICEPAVFCAEPSVDIEATRECINALINAGVSEERAGTDLYCRESGSTLRFLLPVVGALGKRGIFHPMGRLSKRPLSPLYEELCAHGMRISTPGSIPLIADGKLEAGDYVIPGDISSQFVSGLLFALPILEGDSRIFIAGEFQSKGYADMTLATLGRFGIEVTVETLKDSGEGRKLDELENPKTLGTPNSQNATDITIVYHIPGNQRYQLKDEFSGKYNVEGDWSNAAFWFAAGLLGDEGIAIDGLELDSAQGDKIILDVIRTFGGKVDIEKEKTSGPNSEKTNRIRIIPSKGNLKGITFDAGQTPDMIPVVALIATQAKGITSITNAARLRIKESDRLHSIATTLRSLGGDVVELEDGLRIKGNGGKGLHGGTVESFDDHRIAMMAAIASILCRRSDIGSKEQEKVSLIGWEAVNKSYPTFFERLEELGLDDNLELL